MKKWRDTLNKNRNNNNNNNSTILRGTLVAQVRCFYRSAERRILGGESLPRSGLI